MKGLFYCRLMLLLFIAMAKPAQAQVQMAWNCPPYSSDCDKTTYHAPGKCPLCGMTLVQEAIAAHQKKSELKRMKVLFYLQNGVEVLDFAGPLEVFSYAGFDISIVSKTKDPIRSHRGS